MEFTGERMIPGSSVCHKNSRIYLAHTERYKFAAEHTHGKTVLDIACGVGYGSKHLADMGAKHVYGCDIDPCTIDYAKLNYGSNNVTFQTMDATCLVFPDDYFDVVVTFETVEHIDNYVVFLDEVHRVLKPNGKLIISTPNERAYKVKGKSSLSDFHVVTFTTNQFCDLLDVHKWVDISIYGQSPVKKMNKIFRKVSNSIPKLRPENKDNHVVVSIDPGRIYQYNVFVARPFKLAD